jgi:hypothetical protein
VLSGRISTAFQRNNNELVLNTLEDGTLRCVTSQTRTFIIAALPEPLYLTVQQPKGKKQHCSKVAIPFIKELSVM